MTTRTKPHFAQSRTCQGWESLLIGTDGQPLLAISAPNLHDLIERQEEVLWLARRESNFDVTSCGFAVGRITGSRRRLVAFACQSYPSRQAVANGVVQVRRVAQMWEPQALDN